MKLNQNEKKSFKQQQKNGFKWPMDMRIEELCHRWSEDFLKSFIDFSVGQCGNLLIVLVQNSPLQLFTIIFSEFRESVLDNLIPKLIASFVCRISGLRMEKIGAPVLKLVQLIRLHVCSIVSKKAERKQSTRNRPAAAHGIGTESVRGLYHG